MQTKLKQREAQVKARNGKMVRDLVLEIVTTYFLLEILTSVIRYSLILNYQQLVKDRNGVLIQHVYQSVDARKRNMMTGIIVLISQVNPSPWSKSLVQVLGPSPRFYDP